MDSIERTRIQEANLSRLLGMIGAADGRSGLILALDTAMLGVLAALSPKATSWTVGPAVWSVFAAVLQLASLAMLSAASFPRVRGPKGSKLFFEGIAGRSVEQYCKDVSTMTADEYLEDLGKQCHRNSEIAQAKFSWLRASMVLLYLSLIPWLVGLFLLYQAKR